MTSPFTFSFGVYGASAAVFSASEMPRNDRTDPLPHALYFVIYWFSCLLFLKTLFSFYGLSNGSRKPVFKGLYSSERRKSTVVYQRFCFIPHYFHQAIDQQQLIISRALISTLEFGYGILGYCLEYQLVDD